MAGMLTRRTALYSGIGLGATLLVPRISWAQLARTPAQTEGPFYPPSLPLDADNDLVAVKGAPTSARGIVTYVSGRVLDPAGKPVPGARVEIWQCDHQGIYLHPRDREQNRRDAGFQGFGFNLADNEGRYNFRTIKPVAYSNRAPHIHYKVLARNFDPLTTQMYLAGDPLNQRDYLYRSLGAEAPRITVALQPKADARATAPPETGALAGTFDIVLGG